MVAYWSEDTRNRQKNSFFPDSRDIPFDVFCMVAGDGHVDEASQKSILRSSDRSLFLDAE